MALDKLTTDSRTAGPRAPANLRAEEGYPLPEPDDRDLSLPPGLGKAAAPHYLSFASIFNQVSRTYRYTFDEALKAMPSNARAMRRDPVIMDALRDRQMSVAQLPWHLEPRDEKDKRQVDAVEQLTDVIESIPRFQTFKMQLQEATWFGRYAVQSALGWDFSTGRKRLVVQDHWPINGDKLVFRYSGQVGILVHGTFPGDWEPTDRGRAHFFNPEEREQLIVHRHEPEDADFFDGEMAGSIEGVGIRGRLYWFWWMKQQVFAWLLDYLERVGAGGFTIYYYEAGNTDSFNDVKAAAENQFRNNAILFPRYHDGSTGGPGVDRLEPGTAGAQLLESLVTQYFDNVIRRFILGQSLTSEPGATGLGSGVADLHADTYIRRVKYDAVNLEETLTEDLIRVLCKYNHPGVPYPRFRFDIDKPNAAEVIESAKSFFEMGGTIDSDNLRETLGLAEPEAGHAVLSKLPQTAPAGVGAAPTGVPMVGPAGPPGPGGQTPEPGGPPPEDPDAGAEEPRLFRRRILARLNRR